MAILTTTHNGLNFIGGTTYIQTGTTTLMSIALDGSIAFNEYGAGYLKTDASGNITADNTGGGLPGGPYLPLAGGTLTGGLVGTSANFGDGVKSSDGFFNNISGLRLSYPNGGSNNALGNSGTTGAIKITLPQSWTSTMMRMTIKVYEYSEGKSFTVNCGGYNYSNGSVWLSEFAYIESQSEFDRNFTVRFGYDSNNKCCIYIGELTSVWSYPKVFVTDFEAGFNNTIASNWQDGWVISMETTAFENVSKVRENCQINNWKRNGQDVYYGSGSGNVGIGTTTPAGKFNSYISAARQLTHNGNGGDLSIISDNNNNPVMLIKGTGTAALLDIQGTQGQLFSVTDDLSGDIFSVADISGVPILNVNSSGLFTVDGTSYFSGNVSIGTTSSNTPLEVVGGISTTSSDFVIASTGERLLLQTAPSPYSYSYIQATSGGGVMVSEVLALQPDGGGVAIGTTSSGTNKLHIVGNTAKLEGGGSGYTAWFITNSGTGNAGNYYDAINGDTAGGDYGFVGQNNSGYMSYDIGTQSPMPYHVFTGGNVGINTTNPAYLLDVRNGTSSNPIARFSAINAHVIIESSTAGPAVLHLKPNTTGNKSGQFKVTTGNGYNFRWSNDASGTGEVSYMKLDTSTTGGGDLTVKGDIIAYGAPSDKKYKENIKPIESALDKAMQLQGVTFDWKDSESILDIKEDIGFIAQDVQEVLPELVRDNGKGNLSLRYQGITPILLEAIKELKAEIEELKKQIK
jgi:hypothetical protein